MTVAALMSDARRVEFSSFVEWLGRTGSPRTEIAAKAFMEEPIDQIPDLYQVVDRLVEQ